MAPSPGVTRGIRSVAVIIVSTLALAAKDCTKIASPTTGGCSSGQFKCITTLNTRGYTCFSWPANNATVQAYVCLDDRGDVSGSPQVSLDDLNALLSRNPGIRCAAKVRCTR
jgi:hypothetical protein